MNRRDADIAFVLEDQAGVLGVYAVGGVDGIAYAVHLDHGQQLVAKAHYALLRVLTHAECASVGFYHVDLPGPIRAKATRLVLSPGERDDARARVPSTTPALEQESPEPRVPRSTAYSVLLVDMGSTVQRVVESTFGGAGASLRTPGIALAVAKATSTHFDLILCDEANAFGPRGFITVLDRTHPEIARRVVLLVDRPIMHSGHNRFLVKPITAVALLDLSIQPPPFSIPVLPVRGPSSPVPPKRVHGSSARLQARVLLIDDDASALVDRRFAMTVARDTWKALDLIQDDWALVICSFGMKADGGAPLYSLLWKARPEIKRRFTLLAERSDGSGRVLTRPLTVASVTAMLDRIDFIAAPAP